MFYLYICTVIIQLYKYKETQQLRIVRLLKLNFDIIRLTTFVRSVRQTYSTKEKEVI